MGRGLSDLQKRTLQLAYRNRVNRPDDEADFAARWGTGCWRPEWPDDLFMHEAMVDLIGCVRLDRCIPGNYSRHGRMLNRHHGYQINVKETGEERYRAASASLNRTFTRLAARGLVWRPYAGVISLTDAGIDLARSLTVSDVLSHNNANR